MCDELLRCRVFDEDCQEFMISVICIFEMYCDIISHSYFGKL